ncbi:DHA2 family efflux MFS transporter permease subunit [Amorphoplanes digitatis]|uniref:EmrB/QacA subfamily drug resistance transporter n=1 Tax=Actinoplanes digitatis TaxID=1868 RepID=A0A7W7HZ26_9ACTN|nr:DHA2 family efflux MFS transporter permease subunit [Actinoplanes digitatis]MBB4763331.1 EmrB/QacA subfamily drug resistance transporter [Actinoplanes digitatis]GID92149.1 hypothetical protein Adi01nite_15610 [Actinoplanes digitatis]
MTDAERPGLVLLTAAGATFLAFLDTTVVNIAFPALQRDFPDSSLADLSWALTGYGVLFAALLIPAGRLADVTGRRRLFGASVLAFVLTSLLVAIAPSVPFLIAARVLQGAAAAGMIPAALGLVLASTPPARRTNAVGLWAAAGSLAAAAGPSLGGLLIDAFGWRAVFLINVPIGLSLVYLTVTRLPADRDTGRRLPDLAGTVLVAAGIALAVLGLTQGSGWGWADARTLACLIGAAALLPLALFRSMRHPAPAIETDLWRSRVFSAAGLASLTFGMAMFASLLLGPIFLTMVWDYSILKAGLAVSPGALASAVAAVIVGRRATPRGQRIAMIVAALVFSGVCYWLYASLTVEPRYLAVFLPANLISGAAVGVVMTAVSAAAAASLPPQRFAGGTGMVIAARQLGGALGIAAMAAILTERAAAGVDGLLDVMLFCAAVSVVTAATGLALFDKPATEPPRSPDRADRSARTAAS